MKIKTIDEITSDVIWLFLIYAGMIYCSGYAYSLSASSFIRVIFAGLMLLGAFMVSNKKQENSNLLIITGLEKSLFLMLLPLLISIVPGALWGENGQNNIIDTCTIAVIIFSTYLVAKKRETETIRNVFVNGLVIIAAIALIVNWIPVLKDVLSFGYFQSRNGVIYNNGIVWFTRYRGGKMMGVFWEGGLFASYLLLALAQMIMGEKKYPIWKYAILLIAVFYSNSTAGIVLLLLLLMMWLTTIVKSKAFLYCISIVIFFAAAILYLKAEDILSFLVKQYPDIFGKLDNIEAKTTATRFMSPRYNLTVFKQSPFCGVGITEAARRYQEISQNAEDIKGHVAQTSTSTFLLAAEGFLGIAYSLIPCFAIAKNKRYNLISKIAYIALIIFIINKEPHYWLAFTYLLFFVEVEDSQPVRVRAEEKKWKFLRSSNVGSNYYNKQISGR